MMRSFGTWSAARRESELLLGALRGVSESESSAHRMMA